MVGLKKIFRLTTILATVDATAFTSGDDPEKNPNIDERHLL